MRAGLHSVCPACSFLQGHRGPLEPRHAYAQVHAPTHRLHLLTALLLLRLNPSRRSDRRDREDREVRKDRDRSRERRRDRERERERERQRDKEYERERLREKERRREKESRKERSRRDSSRERYRRDSPEISGRRRAASTKLPKVLIDQGIAYVSDCMRERRGKERYIAVPAHEGSSAEAIKVPESKPVASQAGAGARAEVGHPRHAPNGLARPHYRDLAPPLGGAQSV
eukprot:1159336-Pelagomonas_calceolata.AAC.2